MFKSIYFKLLLIFSLVFVLSGCGIFGPEEETLQIDPPPLDLQEPNISLEDSNINIEQTNVMPDSTVSTVNLTIYYFDDKGDVIPLSMDIPKVEGIGKQVLNYMKVGGPAEALLPLGFKPVLPADTKIDLNVKVDQKLAIIDFSKEFLNYEAKSPAEEKKILDAITWSMTEFPTIEQVEIRVNGYVLDAMPVWNTPIVGPLSRADGINLEMANNIDIGHTSPITLYFNRSTQDFNYLVPVTRLIPRTENIAKATIEQLIEGPKAGSNLTSSILPTTKLLEVKVGKNLLVADFDDELLGFDQQLNQNLINMIVWSLSENTHIPSIQIKIKGETNLLPESLSKPIMKPNKINSTLF